MNYPVKDGHTKGAEMLSPKEIARRLRGQNLSRIARQTGISRQALINWRDNPDADVRYSSVRALSAYFAQEDNRTELAG
jgi:transposase-like protein